MKKMNGVFIAALLTLFVAGQVFAQTEVKEEKKADPPKSEQTVTPGKFVDKDGDGVCDHFKARQESGQGRNFVDADGDGVCDHREDNAPCMKAKGNCCGKGAGHRYRHGNGPCKGNQAPGK